MLIIIQSFGHPRSTIGHAVNSNNYTKFSYYYCSVTLNPKFRMKNKFIRIIIKEENRQ